MQNCCPMEICCGGDRPAQKYCGIDGVSGGVEEIDWNGKTVWKYKMASRDQIQHHCFNRMPNGNTLVLGWERVENEGHGRQGP